MSLLDDVLNKKSGGYTPAPTQKKNSSSLLLDDVIGTPKPQPPSIKQQQEEQAPSRFQISPTPIPETPLTASGSFGKQQSGSFEDIEDTPEGALTKTINVFKTAGKALDQGLLSTAIALNTSGNLLFKKMNITSEETFQREMKMNQIVQQYAPQYTRLQDKEKEYQDKPLSEVVKDPEWWALRLGQNVPQLAGAIGVGAAVTIATGGNPFAGVAAGFAFTSAMEGGSAYNDAKSRGATDEQAEKVSLLVGGINGVIEMLPVAKLLHRSVAGKALKDMIFKEVTKDILTQGALEGGTEMVQEVVSNAAARIYDKNQKLFDRAVAESGIIGWVLGSGADIAITPFSGKLGPGAETPITTEVIKEEGGVPPGGATAEPQEEPPENKLNTIIVGSKELKIIEEFTGAGGQTIVRTERFGAQPQEDLITISNFLTSKDGKDLTQAIKEFKSSDFGREGDIQPRNAALENLTRLVEKNTEAVDKLTKARLQAEIEAGRITQNDDNTINIFRIGSPTANELISVTTSQKVVEQLIEQKKIDTGKDQEVIELKVSPNDVRIVIGGVEAELLVSRTVFEPVKEKRLKDLTTVEKRKMGLGETVFKTPADQLAETQLKDLTQETFVRVGLEYYKTTEEYKNLPEGNRQFAENVTTNDLNKHYRDVQDEIKKIESKSTQKEKPKEAEFKVGDVLDPQGGSNMVGRVTIREITGNTLKFTDSEGTDFAGMSRSTVRELVKGGSWKKVDTEVKSQEEQIKEKSKKKEVEVPEEKEKNKKRTFTKKGKERFDNTIAGIKKDLKDDPDRHPAAIIAGRGFTFMDDIQALREYAESIDDKEFLKIMDEAKFPSEKEVSKKPSYNEGVKAEYEDIKKRQKEGITIRENPLSRLAQSARKAKDEADFVSSTIFSNSITGEENKALDRFSGKATTEKLASFYQEVMGKKVSEQVNEVQEVSEDKQVASQKIPRPEAILKKIINKRTTLPVLTEAMVKDGFLYSTNLEVAVKLKTDLTDGMYRMVGDKLGAGLYEVKDFPKIPEAKKELGQVTGQSKDFTTMPALLDKALYSVAYIETRPEINGIHLKTDNGQLRVTSTDSFRMFVGKVGMKIKENFDVIIAEPEKVAFLLDKMKDTGLYTIRQGENNISFKNSNGEIIVRTVGGNYPQIDRVYPQFNQQVIVNKEALQGALKELKPYVNSLNAIKVIFTENEIVLSARNMNEDLFKEIKLPYTKKNIASKGGEVIEGLLVMPMREKDLTLNLQYLTDAARVIDGDKVYISTISGLNGNPIHIHNENLFEEDKGSGAKIRKSIKEKKEESDEKEALSVGYMARRTPESDLPKDTNPARTPEELVQRITQLNKFAQAYAILRKAGKVGNPKFAGVFVSPKNQKGEVSDKGEVRLKAKYISSDKEYMGVLAHELGHALEWNVMGSINKETFKIFGKNLDETTLAQIKSELKKVTLFLEGEENISKHPVYYNRPTELFARFLEMMFVAPGGVESLAPTAHKLLMEQSADQPMIREYLEAVAGNIDKGFRTTKFLPDLRELHQNRLGKRAGNIAYNQIVVHRAMKERAKFAIEELIKKEFEGVKDNPELLFRAAESIKVTKGGEPVFGTRDFANAVNDREVALLVTAGWQPLIEEGQQIYDVKDGKQIPRFWKSRYTEEQGREFFNQLSPEGKELIKNFTAARDEAKSYFNREVIKDVNKINSNIEGWVHHYFDTKIPSSTVGSTTRLKEKIAGARKQRTGAEGFIEDFQKAMTKALVDLEGEKAYRRFLRNYFPRVTKPIPAGKNPDPGWTEVVGDYEKGFGTLEEKRMIIIEDGKTIIPQRIRYQMPTGLYKKFELIKGVVDEASTALKVINSINRYSRINLLTHVGTAGTNFKSGAIQYSAKVLNDFYTETLTGNIQYTQTRKNVAAMLQVLLPKGWGGKDAPDWIYGGDLSNYYGQFTSQQGIFDKSLDAWSDKALKLFGLVERYWKKVIIVSENTSNLKRLEDVGIEGLQLPTEAEEEAIANLNTYTDLYALDYDNVHSYLETHQKSELGQAIKPFLKYPYKYAKSIINFTSDIFDKTLPWETRVSRLLMMATIMGAYAAIAADRDEERETPDPSANTPVRLSPTGRLFITKDKEGRELFVRVSKYPYINLTNAAMLFMDHNWEEGGGVLTDMLGSIGPLGKIGFNLVGLRTKWETYTPLPVLLGDSFATYVPGFRILNDISRMLDPFQRRKETFSQSFTSLIPVTSEDLQRKLHGEVRTERIPLEGDVEKAEGEGVTRTTTDRVLENYWQDILLSSLTGVYITRINPEYAKAFEIRGIENQIEKYDKLKEQTGAAWEAFTTGELTKEQLGRSGLDLLYKRRAIIQETQGYIDELQVADNEVKKKILKNKIIKGMENLSATD